jgi:hypothetical protein
MISDAAASPRSAARPGDFGVNLAEFAREGCREVEKEL